MKTFSFWWSPVFGRRNRSNFWFRPENPSEFQWRSFFFGLYLARLIQTGINFPWPPKIYFCPPSHATLAPGLGLLRINRLLLKMLDLCSTSIPSTVKPKTWRNIKRWFNSFIARQAKFYNFFGTNFKILPLLNRKISVFIFPAICWIPFILK